MKQTAGRISVLLVSRSSLALLGHGVILVFFPLALGILKIEDDLSELPFLVIPFPTLLTSLMLFLGVPGPNRSEFKPPSIPIPCRWTVFVSHICLHL